MDVEMVILRILHIGLGVFWAGAAFYLSSYLFPNARRGWPATGELLSRLASPRFNISIAIAAWLTVLAGLRMMWRLSGGFSASWMSSAHGICYSIGALTAIVALVIGGAQIRPATERFQASWQEASRAADPAARDRHLGEAFAAMGRLTGALRAISALLGITVLMMAVGRYA